MQIQQQVRNSNTTLVKVKSIRRAHVYHWITDSNTTLVKVKWSAMEGSCIYSFNSNTTLVKVKFPPAPQKYNVNGGFKYNSC